MPVGALVIPIRETQCDINIGSRQVRLTNLNKIFWPEQGIAKRDLLQYYADVSGVLLPHLEGRAMVMKRYPNGIEGAFFFMKRAPAGKPDWIEVCTIKHRSGNIIDFPIVNDLASLLWIINLGCIVDFPIVNDLASLLWIINLGCIDLNPWYAKCDDVDRPDYLHFDLDPVPGANSQHVSETALRVREALDELKMPSFAKTSGSKGVHIYVPIVRGPLQKQVWSFTKKIARDLAKRHSTLITAEYRVAHRPTGHVLFDYNQNAWGRTLASVYSIRPKPGAPVSTPVTWKEVEQGLQIEDFRIDNVPDRVRDIGDLFQPLLQQRERVNLESFL